MAKGKKTLGTVKISTFDIAQEVRIAAPPERVFDAIVKDIDQWWAYRFEDKGSTIRLDAKLGGLFYEDFGRGQGALWGTVVYVKRPTRLRLSGPLGMERPVNSLYTYDLQAQAGGTLLTLTHTCFGDLKAQWGKAHQTGWNELLGRFLKAWIEEKKSFRAFPDKKF